MTHSIGDTHSLHDETTVCRQRRMGHITHSQSLCDTRMYSTSLSLVTISLLTLTANANRVCGTKGAIEQSVSVARRCTERCDLDGSLVFRTLLLGQDTNTQLDTALIMAATQCTGIEH
jgi:hypothetical protein